MTGAGIGFAIFSIVLSTVTKQKGQKKKKKVKGDPK